MGHHRHARGDTSHRYTLDSGLRLYATAGRGFETPTLNELAYRSDGRTGLNRAGLNLALKASRSDNAEIGLKARSATWGESKLAWFGVRTHDEIVTLSTLGGRSTFTNAGQSDRPRPTSPSRPATAFLVSRATPLMLASPGHRTRAGAVASKPGPPAVSWLAGATGLIRF